MADSSNNLVEALHSKVQSYLRQKQLAYEARPNGTYHVRHGSTTVVISPMPWNERTIVKVYAPVALEITQITPELTRFLAEENCKLLFGKFSLDVEQKIVWYEHALLGDSLDIEELYVAVGTIVTTADQYDEQISKMAGGKRVEDM